MPRLLLVDDNPSIHRIAESLLAPTDVELVCVDSAAEALDRIERGEHFDVALVDTAMPGMDGWTLLTRLRAMDATARMPIALMAGVLDPVDPSKLAKAPVQGFLKKPIELRELGDRVKALLATPVETLPSPFSTMPATSAADLLRRTEPVLPETRLEPAEPVAQPPAAEPEPPEPEGSIAESIADEVQSPAAEEDLLLLTSEDLWPEGDLPTAGEILGLQESAAAPSDAEVQLDLEELDLDSLDDLAGEPLPLPGAHEPSEPTQELESPAEPDLEPSPLALEEETLATMADLDALEDFTAEFPLPVPPPAPPTPEPAPEPAPALVEAPAPDAAAPAPAGQPTELSQDQAKALLQALASDPALMDALAKAVVARLGDQVLREIAWEVMPDLAGRWQR